MTRFTDSLAVTLVVNENYVEYQSHFKARKAFLEAGALTKQDIRERSSNYLELEKTVDACIKLRIIKNSIWQEGNSPLYPVEHLDSVVNEILEMVYKLTSKGVVYAPNIV